MVHGLPQRLQYNKKQIERALSLQIPSYLPFLIHGTSAGVFAYAARCCLSSLSARIPFALHYPESLPNPTCADEDLNCVNVRSLEWRYFPASSRLRWQRSRRRFCRVRNDQRQHHSFRSKSRAFSSGDSSRSRVCSSKMLASTLDIQFLFRKICMFPSPEINFSFTDFPYANLISANLKLIMYGIFQKSFLKSLWNIRAAYCEFLTAG